MHGGGAPQVKKSAALRLAALVDPAIGVLAKALKQTGDLRLAADVAKDVLNRNGFKSPDEMKLVGAGPNGEIQIENVPASELVKRGIARVIERTRPGSDPRPAD